ncbi:MAG TPA: hypothetical protein DCX54_08035 [Flavobacteriales bacterium]|nr:hypothetical protein [Flavobacteriales bacterium]
MGLDGLELIMAIEEEFKIAITEEESNKIETPNHLTDLVFSKLKKSSQEVCPSQHGFYKVRKTLIKHLNVHRNEVRAETNLADLIHKKSRKKIWKNLLFTLSNGQTVYAPLTRPKWIKISILVFTLGAFIAAMPLTGYEIILSLIFALGCWALFVFLTSFMRNEFPPNFQKVKDLIRIAGSLESKTWTRAEVYNRVKAMIIEQLGVKEEDVSPDSHFINDLGME